MKFKNNQKSKKFNKKQDPAFSMIETLVAITILLIATTGPMVFAQKSLRASFQARDQITAFYLAQDAIEFIKNTRDHYALNRDSLDVNWLLNLPRECDNNYGCTIDTTRLVTNTDAIENCSTPMKPGCVDESPLKINDYGEFSFSGDDSLFYRTVYIDPTVGDDGEMQVRVKIQWTSQEIVGQREIVVVQNIYNWTNELLGNWMTL